MKRRKGRKEAGMCLFRVTGLQVWVLSCKNPQISKAFHVEAFSQQRGCLKLQSIMYGFLCTFHVVQFFGKIWIGVVCQCY